MSTDDDLDEYEKRVQAATTALDEFANQLIADLDVDNGGFGWWKGHADWKPLVLIADYLIASVRGVSAALSAASLAAADHRANIAVESDELEAAFAAVRASKQPPSIHDFAAAIPRDAAARRRQRTITTSAEHCLFHLGQAIDRMASVIIIVGGFGLPNVFRAEWKWIKTIGDDLSQSGTKQSGLIVKAERVQPLGSAGRDVQQKLFDAVLSAPSHGPLEWLDWTRETRNSMTHRPPIRDFSSATSDGVIRLLFRNPRWSEIQALAYGEAPTGQDLSAAVLLPKSTVDVLDGLCISMNGYLSEIAGAVVDCWNTRKAQPALIIQHASQWANPEPSEPPSDFPGYGQDVLFDEGNIVLTHPNEAKRWQAARVFDDQKRQWRA